MFRGGLLLIIRKYYSVHTAIGIYRVIYHDAIYHDAIYHDAIYQDAT
jgi:hypothetical protein